MIKRKWGLCRTHRHILTSSTLLSPIFSRWPNKLLIDSCKTSIELKYLWKHTLRNSQMGPINGVRHSQDPVRWEQWPSFAQRQSFEHCSPNLPASQAGKQIKINLRRWVQKTLQTLETTATQKWTRGAFNGCWEKSRQTGKIINSKETSISKLASSLYRMHMKQTTSIMANTFFKKEIIRSTGGPKWASLTTTQEDR